VISNPGKGSKMQLQEDFTLISDIVKVIVAAALGGLGCGLLGQPIILGYIVAGMIIGPGGLGLIHELVQVLPPATLPDRATAAVRCIQPVARQGAE